MNNNAPASNKSTYIIVAIIVVAALAYFYFQGGKSPDAGALEENPEAERQTQQVLSLLGQIKTIYIDYKFFQGAAFNTLRDFTVPIDSVDVGRDNPFAPVPGMVIEDVQKTR